ncbi:hypothetical protein [Parafrankia sp. FMc2]|uniref:hypothetical protein n=1 Tax=Parafrankia sp. FMc2 TaxID=3233196 RepID=UPI0034D5E635
MDDPAREYGAPPGGTARGRTARGPAGRDGADGGPREEELPGREVTDRDDAYDDYDRDDYDGDGDGLDRDGLDGRGSGRERGGRAPRRGSPARRDGFGAAERFDEPDFPADVHDLDDADDLPGGEDAGLGPFLRRLVIALVVLGVALGVGVGAGVVWEKVRPSGDSASSAPGSEPSATPTGPAGAPTPSAGAPAGGQAPAAVPADWVAHTDPDQRATFSHPPTWKQRRDNTGVFFGEPGAGAAGTPAEYGPRMIGVARVAGVDAPTALSQVQTGEFGSVTGLAQDRSGAATDANGAPTQELAGSYDRDGQRVSYLMRTVEAPGSVYVLIARVPAHEAGTLNTLMAALRTSFQPAG